MDMTITKTLSVLSSNKNAMNHIKNWAIYPLDHIKYGHQTKQSVFNRMVL